MQRPRRLKHTKGRWQKPRGFSIIPDPHKGSARLPGASGDPRRADTRTHHHDPARQQQPQGAQQTVPRSRRRRAGRGVHPVHHPQHRRRGRGMVRGTPRRRRGPEATRRSRRPLRTPSTSGRRRAASRAESSPAGSSSAFPSAGLWKPARRRCARCVRTWPRRVRTPSQWAPSTTTSRTTPHMHILAVDGLEAPNWPRARIDARRANMPPVRPQGGPCATPRRPAPQRPQTAQGAAPGHRRNPQHHRPAGGLGRRGMAVLCRPGHHPPGHDARRPREAHGSAGRPNARPSTTPTTAPACHPAPPAPPAVRTPPPHPFPSPLWPLPQTSGPHPSQASPASATERAGPTASGKPPPGCWHRRAPKAAPAKPKRSSKTGAGLLSPASQTETKNVKAFFFSSMKSIAYVY